MSLGIIGTPTADDANGKLIWTGVVDIDGGSNYSIAVEVPKRMESNGVLTFVNGLSKPVEIPGSSAKFLFSEADSTKDRFVVTLMSKPGKNLSSVMIDLESVIGIKANGRAATALFGSVLREPFKTYRNLWLDSTPHLRLGAVLLSLAKRIEESQ